MTLRYTVKARMNSCIVKVALSLLSKLLSWYTSELLTMWRISPSGLKPGISEDERFTSLPLTISRLSCGEMISTSANESEGTPLKLAAASWLLSGWKEAVAPSPGVVAGVAIAAGAPIRAYAVSKENVFGWGHIPSCHAAQPYPGWEEIPAVVAGPWPSSEFWAGCEHGLMRDCGGRNSSASGPRWSLGTGCVRAGAVPGTREDRCPSTCPSSCWLECGAVVGCAPSSDSSPIGPDPCRWGWGSNWGEFFCNCCCGCGCCCCCRSSAARVSCSDLIESSRAVKVFTTRPAASPDGRTPVDFGISRYNFQSSALVTLGGRDIDAFRSSSFSSPHRYSLGWGLQPRSPIAFGIVTRALSEERQYRERSVTSKASVVSGRQTQTDRPPACQD